MHKSSNTELKPVDSAGNHREVKSPGLIPPKLSSPLKQPGLVPFLVSGVSSIFTGIPAHLYVAGGEEAMCSLQVILTIGDRAQRQILRFMNRAHWQKNHRQVCEILIPKLSVLWI